MLSADCAFQRAAFGLAAWTLLSTIPAQAEDLTREDVRKTFTKAVAFFSQTVATHGGYVYRYSADLTLREGEGEADLETVWVQPPGTPAVGLAFTEAYVRTGDLACKEAALAAARCLLQGQLQSGGWTDRIEFDPARRKRVAYRVDPQAKKSPFNVSTFDDNKTQAALTFLIRLDRALKFQDAEIHQAVLVGLRAIVAAQFPNGAWAQGFDGEIHYTGMLPGQRATLPTDWPKTYPGGRYWWFATLNDNALVDTIELMFLAHHVYQETSFRMAAIQGGEFLLLAQLPEPQPGWAQQYNFQMEPCWARKFEPPAVSGGESQRVISCLCLLYEQTGDQKFLEPVDRALNYLDRSQRADGKLARFYELGSNEPLYMNRQYQLTSSDADLPTHYSFIVPSQVEPLRKMVKDLKMADAKVLTRRREQRWRFGTGKPSRERVRQAVETLDDRGAWVEEGRMSHHRFEGPLIESRTFIQNLDQLGRYLSQE